MKILSSKKYRELIDTIESQLIEIEELEESNRVARTQYYSSINKCDETEKLLSYKNKELEDAKYYNQWLQERLNASEKQIRELLQEKCSLEAEIKRAKEGV